MKINRKIFRTIFKHKSQYFGASLLVALSCMIFTMFGIFGVNILDNLEQFKEEYHQQDAFFIPLGKLSEPTKFEDEYHVKLEERYYQDLEYSDTAKIRLLSAAEEIDQYYVMEGKKLSADDEILIDPGFAAAHDIQVDDHVTFADIDYHVVGFFTEPDYIYALKNEGEMIKNANTFGVGLVNKHVLSDTTDSTLFYSVEYSDQTDATDLKKSISSEMVVLKWVDRDDNLRITFPENDLKAVEPIGRVIPLAIMIVSGVMIAVILGRLLKQEYVQIGALFALGYKKSEIIFHYLRYALLIGLFGSIIGTIAGIFMVNPFLNLTASMYNIPVITIRYYPFYLILSLIMPFFFLIPATLLVTLKALSLSPLELLKNGNKKVRVNWVEKRIKLKHFKFKTVFKIREILKNYSRILFLMLGVIVAASLVLMGFMMKSSMDYLVVNGIENGFSYEYMYTFKDFQTESIEGTESFTLGSFTAKKSNGDEMSILAYGITPDSTMVHLSDKSGNILDFNQVIVSSVLANRTGLAVGDDLVIKNSATEKETNLTIDEIADYSLGTYVFLPLEKLNEICDYESGSYLGLYSDRVLDIDENKLLSQSSRAEMLEGYQLMMAPLQTISLSIGALSFMVGLVVLYVVISMIIMENAESISLLKILGYRKKEIYKITLSGLTFFVVISYLIAVPIIFAALDQLFMTMTADMTMDIPVIIDWAYVVYGFVLVMVIYAVARFLNRRKIEHASMADSLKSKSE
ncbi:FtsX-like permease family protein [Eubacteriaceae bacterium ES3]|nr:FtsX-like permease family protein [Eubacteriaceae bacterium ES3]